MKIPVSFKVGAKTYKVEDVYFARAVGAVGNIHYDKRLLTLALHDNIMGRKRSDAQRYHTFWHETVHAVLSSMGAHALCNDERFVDTFAKRLVQVFTTARF